MKPLSSLAFAMLKLESYAALAILLAGSGPVLAQQDPLSKEPAERAKRNTQAPASSPMQISIEMRMIEVPRPDADEMFKGQGGMAKAFVLGDPGAVDAMIAKGQARVVSQSKITTKSGSNCKNKAVREIIYPTEYFFSASGATNSVNGEPAGSASAQGKAQPASGVLIPMAFETRECGTMFDVTPTLGPDNKTIEISCLFQRVRLSAYASKAKVDGLGGKMEVEQPVFLVEDLTSQFSVKSGATALVAVCDVINDQEKQEQESRNVILFIMTASVVPVCLSGAN
ncbi:MAG: hypothetical protein WC299_14220 [Kiritimatiellia bacterium]